MLGRSLVSSRSGYGGGAGLEAAVEVPAGADGAIGGGASHVALAVHLVLVTTVTVVLSQSRYQGGSEECYHY